MTDTSVPQATPLKVYVPDTGQLGLPVLVCTAHEFVVIKEPYLVESNQPGTFWHTTTSSPSYVAVAPFTAQCKHCGLTKELQVPDTCPKCFRGINDPQNSNQEVYRFGGVRDDPDNYFLGVTDTWACWAVVHSCGCGFSYVWLQYDR